MCGLPSLNRDFKPVLNLASYIRYCLYCLLLKTRLPRLGVQIPFLVRFDAEILCDL